MTLDKIKVFRRPDGSFITYYFFDNAKTKDETSDQFINRSIIKTKDDIPELKNFQEFTKSKSEMINFINSNVGCNRYNIKIDSFGNFYHDKTFKTDQEKLVEIKQSIRTKLKNAQPLNDQEIDAILKAI